MEWLLTPIDPSRPHDLDMYAAWHGRMMVLAWAILLPVGVLVARFAKIMPNQNWPEVCDNRTWWYTHIGLQMAGAAVMMIGFWLILQVEGREESAFYHRWAGYSVICLTAVQFVAAALRGTRGGPKHPAPDGSWKGDHYDMTLRRCVFEFVHKAVGYIGVLLGFVAVFLGMWTANGPRWMFVVIGLWWLVLAALFVLLQRRGLAIDTYQAIWGPDASHPGNRRKPIGWGIRRYHQIGKD